MPCLTGQKVLHLTLIVRWDEKWVIYRSRKLRPTVYQPSVFTTVYDRFGSLVSKSVNYWWTQTKNLKPNLSVKKCHSWHQLWDEIRRGLYTITENFDGLWISFLNSLTQRCYQITQNYFAECVVNWVGKVLNTNTPFRCLQTHRLSQWSQTRTMSSIDMLLFSIKVTSGSVLLSSVISKWGSIEIIFRQHILRPVNNFFSGKIVDLYDGKATKIYFFNFKTQNF